MIGTERQSADNNNTNLKLRKIILNIWNKI